MWGADTVKDWISNAKDFVTQGMQTAVDVAVETYKAEVEGDLTIATRRAQELADLLWKPESGAYERLEAYRVWALNAPPEELVNLQVRVATQMRVNTTDLDPNAIKNNLDRVSAGILAHSEVSQAVGGARRVGVAPIIIAVGAVSLSLSIVALCWARKGMADAFNEAKKLDLLASLGTSEDPEVLKARAEVLTAGGAGKPEGSDNSLTSYVGPAIAGVVVLVGLAVAVPMFLNGRK